MDDETILNIIKREKGKTVIFPSSECSARRRIKFGMHCAKCITDIGDEEYGILEILSLDSETQKGE
jgi:hypothetical protein